jgi:integrase
MFSIKIRTYGLLLVPLTCTVSSSVFGKSGVDRTKLKRRGQTWYARLYVPTEHRDAVGKDELLKTLETSDLRIANSKKHAALADLQAKLDRCVALASQRPNSLARLKATAEVLGEEVRVGSLDPEGADEIISADVDGYLEAQVSKYGRDEETGYPLIPAEIEEQVSNAIRIAGGNQLDHFSKCSEAYLKEVTGTLMHQTVDEKRRGLESLAKWLRRDVELPQIDRKTAGRYISEVITKRGHKLKTMQDALGHVSAFFNWAVDRGYIDSNPFFQMARSLPQSKRGEARSRRRWEEPELVQLLGEGGLDTQDTLWPMAVVALYSGMRLEEIASVKTSDVSADRIRINSGKSESAIRDVPLHPIIKPLVSRLCLESNDGFLISGLLEAGKDSKRGKLIGKRFSQVKQSLGFDKALTFHTFRNTFINECERAKVALATVQQIVGHARTSMSYGRYSHGIPPE